MIHSLTYLKPFYYISFKPEDYNRQDLYTIITNLLKSICKYTPSSTTILSQVEHLITENINGIVIKLVNDKNYYVYGITNMKEYIYRAHLENDDETKIITRYFSMKLSDEQLAYLDRDLNKAYPEYKLVKYTLEERDVKA